MQGRQTFILLLNNYKIHLPTSFPSLQDVNPYIYENLINHYQYKVKSNVPFYALQSFVNNWVRNEKIIFDELSFNYYCELSQEFERIEDIIQLYKQNEKKIESISDNNFEKFRLDDCKKNLIRKNNKFRLILKILFDNINEINNSLKLQDDNFISKKGLKRFCKYSIVKKVKFYANEIIINEGLGYVLNEKEKTAELKSHTRSTKIFIPKSIIYKSQEYIVTSISENAFKYSKDIEEVEFSKDSQMKIIGKRAFYGSAIKSISIPSTVMKIYRNAFNCCSELTEIKIPKDSQLVYIGANAFGNTAISSIYIPQHIQSIEATCFNYCRCLKNVQFSDHSELKIIKDKSFSNSGIENILLPSSVSIIKKKCFYNCNRLKNVDLCQNSKLISIESSAFENSSIESLTIPSSIVQLEHGWCYSTKNLNNIKILQNKKKRISCIDNKLIIGRINPKGDKYDCILFAPRNIEEVKIPSSIKRISSSAFDGCKNLKKVNFIKNSELQIIDDYAFRDCSFKEITIPPNVIEIGQNAFSSLELKKVYFAKESKLKAINMCAFANSSLKKIKIPSSVLSIEENAFKQCKELTKVEFEKNSQLKTIKEGAFSETSLKKITIPCNVQKIENNAFYKCLHLKKVVFLEKSELKNFNLYAFNETPLKKLTIPSNAEQFSQEYCAKFKIEYLKIHQMNKNFKMYKNDFILRKSNKESDVFDEIVLASRNIKKALIPSYIKEIKGNAFKKCELLESVEFSEDSQLVEIGGCAFEESSIESITIPKHVQTIQYCAFQNCKKLKSVKFEDNSELENIMFSAFSGSSIESFKVPSHAYLYHRVFADCNQLKCLEFSEDYDKNSISKCLSGSSVEYLSIPSKIEEFYTFDSFWFDYLLNLKNIFISPNNKNFIYYENEFLITKSESNKFDVLYFANDKKQITFPSFIRKINKYAFTSCNSLQKIDFLDDSKLECIGNNAFNGCFFESISIPKHVKKIGKSSFYSSKVKYVKFDDNCELEIIKSFAFAYSKITSFYIPPNVKIIERCSFFEARNLQIIEFAENTNLNSLEKGKANYIKCLTIPPRMSKYLIENKKSTFFD